MKDNDLASDSVPRNITLSIVSHAQGELIRPLLLDLRRFLGSIDRIVLTLNIPEEEGFFLDLDDLPIQVIRNGKPKGFGANHNAAFESAIGQFFGVVNPDIRLPNFEIQRLVAVAQLPGVGVAAPMVYSSDGVLQDSARRFPTLLGLVNRRFVDAAGPDYAVQAAPTAVDWVAGMFMLFPIETYRALRGFDERYFMYFEDVDLCKRLHAHGKKVMLVPDAHVIHDAQRASHRKPRHFIWHLTSAFRFLSKG